MSEAWCSAQEMAEKWGIHIRTVQSYCASGRIPGAKQFQRSWLIPSDAGKPGRQTKNPKEKDSSGQGGGQIQSLPCMMIASIAPLSQELSAETIHQLTNQADDRLKQVIRHQYQEELAYLKGELGEIRAYVDSVLPESPVFYNAIFLGMVVSVSIGDYIRYEALGRRLKQQTKGETCIYEDMIHAAMAASMLVPQMVPDWVKEGDFSALPMTMVPYALYLQIKYYQCVGKPERMLAVAQTMLSLYNDQKKTTQELYLFLMCASALVCMRRQKEAERYLRQAIELALPLELITPLAENLMNMAGLMEEILKADYPQLYGKVLKQWNIIWKNWAGFHNYFARANVTTILTLREQRIAVLLANGMSYADIAAREGVSRGRIKNIIQNIYGKLMISGRKELEQYIVWTVKSEN